MLDPIRLTTSIALILLVGCAAQVPVPGSWMGYAEKDVVNRWGEPNEVRQSSEDGRILIYETEGKSTQSGKYRMEDIKIYPNEDAGNFSRPDASSVIAGETGPAETVSVRCQVTFTIDKGVVSSWTWTGKSCRGLYNHHRAPG